MRIALVLHAFPPHSRTGVEVYSEGLAREFARRGHRVEVFAPRPDAERPYLSQVRKEREGYGVTFLSLDPRVEEESHRREAPGAAAAFERFLLREQPDVVHIQHCLRLGHEIVDVARAQDRPVVFTAHDAFAISDEYTLLQPDLSPLDPADMLQAARCRRGRGVLDRHLQAHDGFLSPAAAREGDASPSLRSELALALDPKLADESLHEEAARIEERLRLRLQALSRVDAFETPTEFLANLIRERGSSRSIDVQPCGVDLSPFEASRSAQRRQDGPLRVLFIGGYYEHKGPHVLLEASRGLHEQLRLELRGCPGSSSYSRDLEELAEAAGTRLGSEFSREELPSLLGQADLLALPSLWSENAPFVIREAFAAGVPVLASDTPALRESVRDEVDGLLVRRGDVAAWRSALLRLAEDRELLQALSDGVRAPLSLSQDAERLVQLYSGLIADFDGDRSRRRARLPEHLHDFAQRFDRLQGLPTRDLIQAAARALEASSEPGTLPAQALLGAIDHGQGLRERLAGAERADRWRRETEEALKREGREREQQLEGLRTSLGAEKSRADWNARVLAEREQRLLWREEILEDREQALQAAQGQVDLSRESLEAARAELTLARESLAALRAEGEWLAETQSDLRKRLEQESRALGAARDECEWRAQDSKRREEESNWLRASLEDRVAQAKELEARAAQQALACEHQLAELAELRQARGELERRLQQAQDQSKQLEARLREDNLRMGELEQHGLAQREAFEELSRDREAARAHEHHLDAQLAAKQESIEDMQRELASRREEMRLAAEAGNSWLRRLTSGDLRTRLESWRNEQGDDR